MNEKNRLMIVEDHTLLRAGLRSLLSADEALEIVGEAENGREALRRVGSLRPDLLLTDLSMPGMNGMELIRYLKRRYPEIRVLVLTVHRTEEYIYESMKAGADGYLLKDSTHEELHSAIRTVLAGKIYLSPEISDKVVGAYLGKERTAHSSQDQLTHREREVLKLVAEGHSNKLVAENLCISVKTVEKHRSNLMKKLDLHNASSLTAYAIEKGLLVWDR